jgi:hypothetical protein
MITDTGKQKQVKQGGTSPGLLMTAKLQQSFWKGRKRWAYVGKRLERGIGAVKGRQFNK